MEGTLGHLGENAGHGVGAVLGLLAGVLQDVGAVGGELVVQEEVNEVDLADDVDEIEHFHGEEPESVEGVGTPMEAEVLDNLVDLAFLGARVEEGFLEVGDEHADLVVLRGFPEVPGDVEEHGLQEKEKGHPLVPFVVFDVLAVLEVAHGGYPGMGHAFTLFTDPSGI